MLTEAQIEKVKNYASRMKPLEIAETMRVSEDDVRAVLGAAPAPAPKPEPVVEEAPIVEEAPVEEETTEVDEEE